MDKSAVVDSNTTGFVNMVRHGKTLAAASLQALALRLPLASGAAKEGLSGISRVDQSGSHVHRLKRFLGRAAPQPA